LSERVCGDCTLCCRFFAVPELGKPEAEWCRHCTQAGCAIHATRPQSCRNFDCFWLLDEAFSDDLRPDRCGVVAWWNGADHESVVLHVDPDRPDALARVPGSELLRAVMAGFERVYVVCGDERVMLRRGQPQEP
jgi:hypothetical protein